MKDRISSPDFRVVGTAPCTETSAPLVSEYDLFAVIRERGRVPVRVVRIVNGVHTLWIGRVLDVKQDAVARARTGGKADRRVRRDVVTLVGVRGLRRSVM